jgi:hypothetical protein
VVAGAAVTAGAVLAAGAGALVSPHATDSSATAQAAAHSFFI